MAPSKRPPLLLAVTPDNAARHPELGRAWLEELCAGFSSSHLPGRHVVVQLRDRKASDKQLAEVIVGFRQVCNARDLRLILHRRTDLAIKLGLDGVHYPAAALEESDTLGTSSFSGASCHSLSEIRTAAQKGMSYVVFGPVFDTPSKRPYGAPQGTRKLALASALGDQLGLPVLAIGGIDETTAYLALESGAHGLAAIRALGVAKTAKGLCNVLAERRTKLLSAKSPRQLAVSI